jgi:hypothetical protein
MWNDQLVFHSYPFVRLIGAFDPVPEVAAFGRQKGYQEIVPPAFPGILTSSGSAHFAGILEIRPRR